MKAKILKQWSSDPNRPGVWVKRDMEHFRLVRTVAGRFVVEKRSKDSMGKLCWKVVSTDKEIDSSWILRVLFPDEE